MVIAPDGQIFDEEWMASPKKGDRIAWHNKTLTVMESFQSMVPVSNNGWDWIVSFRSL